MFPISCTLIEFDRSQTARLVYCRHFASFLFLPSGLSREKRLCPVSLYL